MKNRIGRLVSAAALATLAPLALAQGGAVNRDLQAARRALHLADASVQRLAIPPLDAGPVELDVTLAGRAHTVVLVPHSFRRPGFTLSITDAAGNPVRVDAPPPRTLRGELLDLPGSAAAGSIIAGSFSGTILLPDGGAWTIEPLRNAVPGADPALHVVYDSAAAMPDGHVCGVADDAPELEPADGAAPPGGSRAFENCEIALDADYEYYANKFGSNLANTLADMENIIANTAIAYERDCNVTFTITDAIVRTSEPDPYSTTDPEGLLTQFRNHWNANHDDIHRDIAHLFTGKNLNGGVIGIAYLSVVCSSTNGYGLVESKYGGGLNNRIGLSAHELGHNFSAGHCDGSSPCKIMCSGINGCDRLGTPPQFGVSATKITNYAANRPCLDDGGGGGGGLDLPFADDFPSTTIDPVKWTAISGAAVTDLASNEPSAPYSLFLGATGSVESERLLTEHLFGTPMYASFWAQPRFTSAGDSLFAEFYSALGSWQPIATLVSDGSNPSTFAFTEVVLPFDAYHNDLRVRFRASNDIFLEEWYVDDVSVSTTCRVDLTADGAVNSSDFLAYLNFFNSADPVGDWNKDGSINTLDFLAYLNDFSNGCPD